MCQGGDRVHDRQGIRPRRHLPHKGLVDLDLVEGEAAQVAERGIARPEIVQRRADAEVAELAENGHDALVVLQQRGFRDLQLQPARRQAGGLQRRADGLHDVAALELQGRQVHRHPDRVGPAHRLGTGAAQHPFADGHDEAHLLGQGDELRRRDRAALRVAPAQQGLEAVEPAVLQIEDRLVDEGQLLLCQGRAQVGLQQRPLVDLGLHRILEDAVGAAPGFLGAVEGEVGLAEQLVRRDPVVLRRGDADAHAHHHDPSGQAVGRADHLDDALGQELRLVRLVERAVQHGELVAAQPRHDLRGAQAALQALPHQLQQRIARRMAKRVVHQLELVEVEAEHGHLVAPRPQVLQRLLHLAAKEMPVGQAREHVVMRHEADAGLGAPALGDVVIGRDPAAIRHRLLRHLQGAALGHLHHQLGALLLFREAAVLLQAALRQLPPRTLMPGEAEQLLRLHPLPHRGGRDVEEVEEADIADDQPLRRIHHAQALRHVVQRGIEARVLHVQVAVALVQDLVLRLRLQHRLLHVLLGLDQLLPVAAEVGDQCLHPCIGLPQQAVVADQEGDEAQGAQDQPEQDAREGPVQHRQVAQVLGIALGTVAIGGRRDAQQVLVDGGQQPQNLLRRAGRPQPWQQRLDLGGDLVCPRQGGVHIRAPVEELARLAIAEELQPVLEDVEPELDLLLVPVAVGQGVEGHHGLQPVQLRHGLGHQPGEVVARHVLQRVLALDDQDGQVEGHADQQDRGRQQHGSRARGPGRQGDRCRERGRAGGRLHRAT